LGAQIGAKPKGFSAIFYWMAFKYLLSGLIWGLATGNEKPEVRQVESVVFN
jgi:hypothetical protein